MANELYFILLSTFLASAMSLIGIFALASSGKTLNKLTSFLVSLSIGGLLGGAFLHLIPEAVEKTNIQNVSLLVLGGFFLFFLIERFFHWRHCHDEKCEIHPFAYTNLVGDSIHNFIDGLIIAGSFLTSTSVGFASTLAIIIHEIPQELGDFGVLIYAGFSKKKAILFNFLTALTAVFGGLIGYFFFSYVQGFLIYLLPIAAGGFIYVGASDLIPEIRKENSFGKSILHLIVILLGILAMYLLKGMA